MKKTTTNYSLKVHELVNRDDHYQVTGHIGPVKIDQVLERSSIRHIIETLDKSIGTGL